MVDKYPTHFKKFLSDQPVSIDQHNYLHLYSWKLVPGIYPTQAMPFESENW